MGLTDRLTGAWNALTRSNPPFTLQQYAEIMSFNGNSYLVGALQQTINGKVEEVGTAFDSLVQAAYRTNAVVFACELARISLFSEARFQYQALRNGRPGELFSQPSLDILEHPWPTAITGDLLTRALLDADFGGTAFHTRRRSGIRRLRPDWVTMVLGSESDPEVQAGDIDADLLGVIYHPGGRASGRPPVGILRSELSVFAPVPDPLATYRGMPWVMPVIREIISDKQMTEHKSAFLVNGATPNLTVAIDKDLKEAQNPKAFLEWVEAFKKVNPTGSQWDKFKTWYLAGGTTVTKVGSNMQEVDFKQVQGAGETRIAAAAGVPPVIVGLSEGLQAATYSNYGQARRRFADNTMRPLWRNMAGSLETIVPPPPGSRLWYDDRDIQALAEDKKDLAEVRQLDALSMGSLLREGFKPETVVAAITTGDLTQLVHTGLISVQLQRPGAQDQPQVPAVVPTNGASKRSEEMLWAYMARPQAIPSVTIERGAIQVEQPAIHVPVTIAEGAVQVTTPEVRVSSEAPVVNVTVPEQAAPVVNVTLPEQPAPIVTVNVPQPPTTRKRIERNAAGAAVAIVEERDGG